MYSETPTHMQKSMSYQTFTKQKKELEISPECAVFKELLYQS